MNKYFIILILFVTLFQGIVYADSITDRKIFTGNPTYDLTGPLHKAWYDTRIYVHPDNQPVFMNQTNNFYPFLVNSNFTGEGHASGYNCNLYYETINGEINCYISSVTMNGTGRAKAIHGTAVDLIGSHGILAGVIGQVMPSNTTVNSRAVTGADLSNSQGKSSLFYGMDYVPQINGLDFTHATFTNNAIYLNSFNCASTKIAFTDGSFLCDYNRIINIGLGNSSKMQIDTRTSNQISIGLTEGKRTWQIQAYNDTNGDYLRILGPSIGNVIKIDQYGHIYILDTSSNQCYLKAFPNGTMFCQH